jgi:anti-sigma factor ChrR (cupin superfamily)
VREAVSIHEAALAADCPEAATDRAALAAILPGRARDHAAAARQRPVLHRMLVLLGQQLAAKRPTPQPARSRAIARLRSP